MDVIFWGVRGSIPCCGPENRRGGGDTSCVGVRVGDTLVVLDAGTGIRDLGRWLEANHPDVRKIHLFLSHAHYDHVIGFPFFSPIWNPAFEIHVYATTLNSFGGVQHFFDKTLFAPPFFPVSLSQLAAKISYYDCQNGDVVQLEGGVQVRIFPLNHPGGASGFRVEGAGKSLCYVSDTEHCVEAGLDKDILQAVQDCDLMIYDASFTDEEYPAHVGWGHSTWQEGVRLCQEARVKRLAIFHHEPSHTDDMLDAIESQARVVFENAFVAREDQHIAL